MVFSSSCNSQTIRLFTGKFTEAGEKGLYIFDLNREEGTLKLLSESDAGPNPSYFCISLNPQKVINNSSQNIV